MSGIVPSRRPQSWSIGARHSGNFSLHAWPRRCTFKGVNRRPKYSGHALALGNVQFGGCATRLGGKPVMVTDVPGMPEYRLKIKRVMEGSWYLYIPIRMYLSSGS
jgi:hypothetical protein